VEKTLNWEKKPLTKGEKQKQNQGRNLERKNKTTK
jgi:hypothetical protein